MRQYDIQQMFLVLKRHLHPKPNKIYCLNCIYQHVMCMIVINKHFIKINKLTINKPPKYVYQMWHKKQKKL